MTFAAGGAEFNFALWQLGIFAVGAFVVGILLSNAAIALSIVVVSVFAWFGFNLFSMLSLTSSVLPYFQPGNKELWHAIIAVFLKAALVYLACSVIALIAGRKIHKLYARCEAA